MTKFIVLAETSGKEHETWYYFIQYDGNEEVLSDLKEQLESFNQSIIDDCSIFRLDLDNKLNEETVNEMVKIDVNNYMLHKKLVGKLRPIKFGFIEGDDDDEKMMKVDDTLSVSGIEKMMDLT